MKSTAPATEIKKSDFIFFSCLLFLLALDLRLCLIGIKPFHNDEGVNAHFLLELIRHGKYEYDPQNYHGPFIYFVTAVLVKLLGLSDFTLRFSPVLFSIVQLLLLFLLRKSLKKIGTLTALALMGFSPNIVYFARTFIHETYFTSLTLAAFVALYFLFEKRNVRFLIPAALAVAFMVTVKETFAITLACWGFSAVLAGLVATKDKKFTVRKTFPNAADLIPLIVYTGLAVCSFLLVYLLLYSSFFKNPAGPWRAIESLFRWEGRSRYEHVKGFYYYFKILRRYELPILILTGAGIVYSFWRRNFFLIFVSTWTISIFLIYSFIPYKTPWLILNILLPAILTASAAAGNAVSPLLTTKIRKEIFALALLVCTLSPATLSVEANFFRYDDDRLPMVYVQTDRTYKNLFPIWNILRMKYGDRTKTGILSPSYWPLPWDLRDHKTVGYYGKLVSNLTDHPFLITEDTQRVEAGKIYGETHHKLEMPFALHSGFNLYLWMKNDIWEDTFGDSTWSPAANSAKGSPSETNF